MSKDDLLKGKRILIVDDEPDVLETLEDYLNMCDIVKASRFDEAIDLLVSMYFDMAIIDIMGVDGYKILEIANDKKVLSVMLTAHALSPDNIVRSYKEGAASYIPKDEMSDITIFLTDILEAKEKGKSFWWRWLERLDSYCEKKFGEDWKNIDKAFWDDFGYFM
jgi:DNA-binding NtrC family response regulator